MSDSGYVYVLMNPSMLNLIKIGKTTRTPAERAKELSSTTGVPTPFVVAYDEYFENCSEAETFVHTLLEEKGYRVSDNREFFEIPIKDAIDTILEAKLNLGNRSSDKKGKHNSDADELINNSSNEAGGIPPHEVFSQKADAFYYGTDDEIQSYSDAVEYYEKAIKAGSTRAYIAIGRMYLYGEGVSKNESKALDFFKIAKGKGNNNAYAEMGMLFTLTGHVDNATKSWKKYFEFTENLSLFYCGSYLIFLDTSGLSLQYLDKLKSVEGMYNIIGRYYRLHGDEDDMAMDILIEGIENGDSICYAELGPLLAKKGKLDDAIKMWDAYFKSDEILPNHGVSYITFITENELELQHLDKLGLIKTDMIQVYLDLIDEYEQKDMLFIAESFLENINFIKENI